MMLTNAAVALKLALTSQRLILPLQFADWFRFLLSQAFLQTILLALNIMCETECVCEREQEGD